MADAGWRFEDARDLFRQVEGAALDSARYRRVLAEMERHAEGMGGGLSQASGGGSVADPMAEIVARIVDREAATRGRLARADATLDLARRVLYGTGEFHAPDGGLSSVVPEWWCDVLWVRHRKRRTWEVVALAVGHSKRHCIRVEQMALDTLDSWGIQNAIVGRPLNSVETWERDARRRDVQAPLH